MRIDPERVIFLRGLLVAFASNAQLLNYDEMRRLCRLSDEQMGAYLDEARKALAEGEPDFCAIVVKTAGKPGQGWGDAAIWAQEVQRSHRFGSDRRALDNGEFQARHGRLPAIPGLPASEK